MEASLKTLLKRLDEVTSRLEKVEKNLASGGPAAPCGVAAAGAPAAAASCPAKDAYDALIAKSLIPIVALSEKISKTLGDQVKEFVEVVKSEGKVIGIAAASKKPEQSVLEGIMKPIGEALNKISEYKSKYGRAPEFNCIAGVSEAVPCLNWLVIEPTPAPFIREMIPGSEFYTNRVLVQYKGKDVTFIDWAKGFNAFLKELADYVKQWHTTGLAWNPKGGDASAAAAGGASEDSGAPPPPPPPPVCDPTAAAASPQERKGAASAALFAEISKGTAVSSGLKHVANEQKTKYRTAEDREKGNLAPKEKAPTAAPKGADVKKKAKGPAKLELVGSKWVVENQVKNQDMHIKDAERNQTVYVFGCEGSTLVVDNKINCVTIDSCDKCAIVLDSVVASVEIVNCNSTQVQVKGKTPAMNIDKCGGVTIHLSKEALADPATEMYTSKCSSTNVVIPDKSGDDTVELAVPEQFRSVVKGGKLVTEFSSHV